MVLPPIPQDDGVGAEYAPAHTPLAASLDRLTTRLFCELYAFLGPSDALYRITARQVASPLLSPGLRWWSAWHAFTLSAPLSYSARWLDEHTTAAPPPPCPACGGPRRWLAYGGVFCPAGGPGCRHEVVR